MAIDKVKTMPANHQEQLTYLKKIEGQIHGIGKMIEDRRYCIDIITQVHSVIGALHRVENEIFKKHVNHCVTNALSGKSKSEKQKKIDEIIELVSRFRKIA